MPTAKFNKFGLASPLATLGAGVGVPEPVFDPSDETFWWDFQDQSTLYQNSTLTTPVTAPGQIIAGVTDKTGNNHPLSFVTSTAIYDFFDAVAAVSFNGTDGQLRSNTLAALMSGAALPPFAFAWAEYDPDSAGATQTRFSFGSSGSAPRFHCRGNATGVLSLVTQPTLGSAQTHNFNSGAELQAQRWVMTFDGTTLKTYRNGTEVYSGAVTQGAFAFDRMAVGSQYRNSATDFGEFKLGEFFGRIGTIYSAEELAGVQAYLLERFPVSDPGALAPTGNVSLHVIAGQSNAEGRGVQAESPVVAEGDAFYLTGSTFSYLNDPVGNAEYGSAWPAFAIQWKDDTANTSIWVETARGGTSVLTNETPNWNVAGTLAPASRTALNAAVANINSTPGCTLTGTYLHWAEGESAARMLTAASATIEQYKIDLKATFEAYKAQCPSLDLIFVYELGARNPGDREPAMSAIRAVQHEIASELAYVHVVYEDAKTFPARSLMKDNDHYKQAGYNEMGTVGATAAALLV